MKIDKSPGADGFTVEFFKFFWAELSEYITRSKNDSYNKGEFTNAQNLGMITSIPKPDKNRQLVKNWITPLSNLKIASGCIAKRLKTKLLTIINDDQTGFLKGRFIGENIRIVYDIMSYTEFNTIPGLSMLIDFKKSN